MSTQNIQLNIVSGPQVPKVTSSPPEEFMANLEGSLDLLCKLKTLSRSLKALRSLHQRISALEDQISELESCGCSCDQRNITYQRALEQETTLFEAIEDDISSLDPESLATLKAMVSSQQESL